MTRGTKIKKLNSSPVSSLAINQEGLSLKATTSDGILFVDKHTVTICGNGVRLTVPLDRVDKYDYRFNDNHLTVWLKAVQS